MTRPSTVPVSGVSWPVSYYKLLCKMGGADLFVLRGLSRRQSVAAGTTTNCLITRAQSRRRNVTAGAGENHVTSALGFAAGRWRQGVQVREAYESRIWHQIRR